MNNVVKEGGFVRGRSQSSQQKKVWMHVDIPQNKHIVFVWLRYK